MAEIVFDVLRVLARKLFCLVLNSTCSVLLGVVIPAHFGSTTQSSQLQDASDGLIVDLKNAVSLSLTAEQQSRLDKAKQAGEDVSYNSLFYPIAKQYVQTLRQDFKNKRITLLCSDYKLLKYVGVKEITYLSPSQKFLEAVIERTDDEATKSQIRSSVLQVLQNKGMKSIIFSSFDEITSILKDELGLRSKIQI